MSSKDTAEEVVEEIKEVIMESDVDSDNELSDEEIYEKIVEGKNYISDSQNKVKRGVLLIILLLIALWGIYIIFLFAKHINPDLSIVLSISSVGLGTASIIFIYHTLLSQVAEEINYNNMLYQIKKSIIKNKETVESIEKNTEKLIRETEKIRSKDNAKILELLEELLEKIDK